MAKKNNESVSAYVPMGLISNSLIKSRNNPMRKRMMDFISVNKIIGPLKWETLEKLDQQLAEDYRKYAEENKNRLDLKYTEFGAEREKQAYQRKLKKAISLQKVEAKKGVKTTKEKPSKKVTYISKEARVLAANRLLKKNITELNAIEIKSIIAYADVDIKQVEPYFNRLQSLKSSKVDYNKPKPIQAAKALLTFNFSGKSNPLKWINYEPIIKAKLYCAKMGIEYLKAEAPDELKSVMQKIKPNLEKVLKELDKKNIDEIKF